MDHDYLSPIMGRYTIEKDVEKLTEHIEEVKETLACLSKNLEIKPPDFDTILLSDSRDWKLDYRGYHYVYLWMPLAAGMTMSFGDYGTGLVPGQQWVNLGMRPGTIVKTSGNGQTPQAHHLCFTDVRL